VALLVGVAVAALAADLLLAPRIGSPQWTCVSSGSPTSI
jgi:hypothetical protein